jgi:hypothetical protein
MTQASGRRIISAKYIVMNDLSIDKDFVVKESVGVNLIVAIAFFGMFFYGLYDKIEKGQEGRHLEILMLALVPGFLFLRKAVSKNRDITINKNGICINNRLITNWSNFIEAKIIQQEVTLSIQDNFVLFITYREGPRIFRNKIPLRNTQNKAEEEIIEAIRFYRAG